ncbi:MAG TPA: TonB-dependent receptor [Caulobacteraceae bacterium]|jgi:outer membrane receptor protein involved in Fe transport|nr:TonB-dependent receptor [Caulobacteraceae bacterium]
MTVRIHRQTRNLRPLLLGGAAAALFAGPAFAAASDNAASDNKVTSVQEVVVTAQKRTERVQDVPMSLETISGDHLTATQATTLQDVANQVPGLQLIQSGPTENELVIRGLSVGAGINSSVATYVDETPYTTVGPFAYSANLAPNFDTYDLSRIEVLRGPQGTLYGASAMGGLLKYVTNAPDPTHFSASMLAGVSSVDHSNQTGWEIHGMVNIPLGENLALRIVGEDDYQPGFIDDPARGKKDINDVRRYGGRASLLWTPNQDLSIRLSAAYQHIKAGDLGAEDISAATLQPLFGQLTQERAIAQTNMVTNEVYNGTVNWNLGFADLVSSSSYSQVNPHTVGDLSSVYGPILQGIFGQPLGAEVVAIEPVNSFTQELRLTSAKNQNLEWTVGAYYDNESADEHEPLYPVDLATGQALTSFTPALGAYHITSTYREWAGFADFTYHFTPAFEVGLGGRYSSNSQTYHQVNAGFFTGTDDFVTNSNQSVFTYSVDAKYRFSPDLMVYARIATGFVPGGPNDVLPGSTLPESFKSSSTTNYEVGVKGSAADGQITYDLDAFDVEWQQIQLIAEVNNLYGATNGGTARSRGLEGDVNYRPITGLSLGLSAAYTDARLTQATPASFGGLPGDRLPLSPYISTTASASYEWPLNSEWTGFAGGDWHYEGDRMSEFEFGAPRQDLPSYSMVNLRAGVKFQNYTLTVYVKNVGDEKAISSVSPENLGGVSALSAVIATPRTIGVTVGAKF